MDLLGQKIGGRYLLQRKLGEGGMASVFLAIDEKLKRPVAVKILLGHMEKNPEVRLRFQQEAQAISGLDHPNIVKIYDYSGADSQNLWFVTEVIRGQNLAEIAGKQPQRRLHPIIGSCIIRETAKALSHAHSIGIIHRDIKPENIMITYDGVLKLMDFGIAKINQNQSVTTTGAFMGSPSYMSPEQIRGRLIDHRSDLYSLSVVFYEMLTGRLPFVGSSTHDVILRITEGRYTHPIFINEEIPEMLNSFIIRGLSRSLDDRFSSALEMEKILQDFLLASHYDESHVELQRYFRDPELYQSQVLSRKTKPLISTVHLTQAHKKSTTQQLDKTELVAPEPAPPQEEALPRTEILPTGLRPRPATPPIITSSPPVASAEKTRHEEVASPQKHQVAAAKPAPQASSSVAVKHYHVLVGSSKNRSGLFVLFLGLAAFIGAGAWIGYETFLRPDKATRPLPQNIPLPTPGVEPTPTLPPTQAPTAEPTVRPEVPVQPQPTQEPPVRPSLTAAPAARKDRPRKPKATAAPRTSAKPAPKPKQSTMPSGSGKPIAASPSLVRIASVPAAEIYYRGRKIGTTIDGGSSSQPILIDRQPFEVELRRSGFLSQKLKIEASRTVNGTVLGPIQLQRDTFDRDLSGEGSLTAQSSKRDLWMTIESLDSTFRDKKLVSAGPTTVRLKYGRYRVTFEAKSGAKKSRIIQLNAQQDRLQLDLSSWDDRP